MTWRIAGLVFFASLVSGLALGAPAARADEYVIGPDDVLAVSVWLHPELERTVTVSASGTIVFPPVDTGRFRPNLAPPEAFFLVVSRLIPYKRVDLAVQAFNELGLPLVVIGDGRERAKLEAMAGPNIQFNGPYGRPQLDGLIQSVHAVLVPT